jgi:hypothetical protein
MSDPTAWAASLARRLLGLGLAVAVVTGCSGTIELSTHARGQLDGGRGPGATVDAGADVANDAGGVSYADAPAGSDAVGGADAGSGAMSGDAAGSDAVSGDDAGSDAVSGDDAGSDAVSGDDAGSDAVSGDDAGSEPSHDSGLPAGNDAGGSCTPTTCAAQGKNCGTIPDTCDGTVSCGTCTAPQTCGGGGTANVCGGGSGDSVVVMTVGDITAGSNAQAVANRIKAHSPVAILMTGDFDNARSPASLANILADIDPLYGPKPGGLYPIIHPVAGPTHDVSSCTSWGGYQSYWGRDPTQPYSFDIAIPGGGSWHVMSLPDIVARYSCSSPTVQAITDWINSDLAAHTNLCTIAFWHQPYFTSTTSGHGPFDPVQPWVQALYDHGVDIVVSGHQNGDFEAFYPQSPARVRDDAHGLQAFVAATGGQSGYTYTSTAPNSITKAAGVYGALMLTLRNGSYDWKFDQAVGSGYSPSGSGTCR